MTAATLNGERGARRVRAMRILLVSDFYAPVIGGIERYVQMLARELVRRGHHVVVATLRQDDSAAFEIDEGVHVHRLEGWSRMLTPFYDDPRRRYHPTLPDPGVIRALRRIVACERPDVLHAQGWMLYSCLPLKRRDGPALIVGLHDYGLVCARKNYLHDGAPCSGPAYAKCVRCASEQYGPVKALGLTSGLFASGRLHRRVDRYIANSSAVAEASRAGRRGATEAIDVVPALVPDGAAEAAARAPRPAFLPAGDFILFVGAIGRHKGIDVLLESHARLEPPVPLVVIGTARADTPARFPRGVSVVFDVPHSEVMASWARCLAAVVPSVWPEPFGQVAAEAMACGRPVVATAVGGLRDVVLDGETGVLVPPGDARALSEALSRLLADPDRRARMGEAGRRRARRFEVTAVTDRIERIYADEIARRRDRRPDGPAARPRRPTQATAPAREAQPWS